MVLKSVANYRINENVQLIVDFAAIEDTKAISRVLAQSFYRLPEFASWIYPFLQFTISEDIRHRLRSQSPHYCCLVAKIAPQNYLNSSNSSEVDNKELVIVGTIEIAMRSPSLWLNTPQYPYISNLAVDQKYRRLGIGKLLLARCEQAAMDWGYSETRLHVLDNNDAAKYLYHSGGYQIAQIEANWSNMWFDYSPRLLLKKEINLE